MPVLSNPRHERFAQALASGETAGKSYVIAGYNENGGNASRLKDNENIVARVEEILGHAAAEIGVTVEGQTAHLRRIAHKAEKLGETGGMSVARQAHMDIAKLNGLIVEKQERKSVGDDLEPRRVAEIRSILDEERARRLDS